MSKQDWNDEQHKALKRRLIQEIYERGDNYGDDIVPATQEEMDTIAAEWDALTDEQKEEYAPKDFDLQRFKARFEDIRKSADNARRIRDSIKRTLGGKDIDGLR